MSEEKEYVKIPRKEIEKLAKEAEKIGVIVELIQRKLHASAKR